MRSCLRFAALITLVSLAPTPALACFAVGKLKLDGYPRDGAENVPLDAVPIYQLSMGEADYLIPIPPRDGGVPDAGLLDGAVLVSPFATLLPEAKLSNEDGDVPVEVRAAEDGFFEIVPDAPLAPQTQYTLVVTWKETESGGFAYFPSLPDAGRPLVTVDKQETVSFRTGDSAYAGDTSAPAVFATQYVGERLTTDCDPPPRAVCFSLPDDEALYLTRFEGDPMITLERGSFFNNRLYREESSAQLDCMQIRLRAPNGTLGDAARSCRDEWTAYDLAQVLQPKDNSDIGLSCDSAGLHWGMHLVSERYELAKLPKPIDAGPGAANEDDVASDHEDERSAAKARGDDGCSLAPGGRSTVNTAWLLLALALGLTSRLRAAPGSRRRSAGSAGCPWSRRRSSRAARCARDPSS